jgi:hypothetical protein
LSFSNLTEHHQFYKKNGQDFLDFFSFLFSPFLEKLLNQAALINL